MTRKDFLLKTLGFAGAAAVGASLLNGCEPTANDRPCDSSEGLQDIELRRRRSVHYVSLSPVAQKNCRNCEFFASRLAQGGCGECQLFAGTVRPEGYCDIWVKR